MAIGIFIYQQQLASSRQPISPEQLSQTFETYSNNDLGFTIEYPKAMKISSDGWQEYMDNNHYSLSLIGNGENTANSPRYHITIQVHPKVTEETWNPIKKSGQAAIIAGQSAVKTEVTESDGARYMKYSLIRNGVLYILEAGTLNDAIVPLRSLDEVLRTFDFLGTTDSLPVGWQKTIVEPGKFSVASPSHWKTSRGSNFLELSNESSKVRVTWGKNLKEPRFFAMGTMSDGKIYSNAGNFAICDKYEEHNLVGQSCDTFVQWDPEKPEEVIMKYIFNTTQSPAEDDTPIEILRTFSFL